LPSRAQHLTTAPTAPAAGRPKAPPLASLIRTAATSTHDDFFAHLHAALRREIGHCDLSVGQLDAAGAGFIARCMRRLHRPSLPPVLVSARKCQQLATDCPVEIGYQLSQVLACFKAIGNRSIKVGQSAAYFDAGV